MMLKEQVFAHALLLAGELTGHETDLLGVLCAAATSSLTARLKKGLTPEDCKADFVAAASLYAVAAMAEAGNAGDVEQFSVGDLTVRRASKDAASCCLRYQAELLMMPFLKDRVAFLGV
jgi:alpha-D-ribose 1-methylphosphonate 5-triphosphate synthase subunit PhnG